MPVVASDLPRATAETVYEKPASGEFTELLFGSDHGNTLWIRFADEDGLNEWIGKFGCGYASTIMRVTPAGPPDHFMVVAGGFAYLIDATRRQLLNHYTRERTQDVIFDCQTRRFIVADTHLRIIEDGREIWTSPRIALDRIEHLRLQGRILTGQSSAIPGYEERSLSNTECTGRGGGLPFLLMPYNE